MSVCGERVIVEEGGRTSFFSVLSRKESVIHGMNYAVRIRGMTEKTRILPAKGVSIHRAITSELAEILTPEAIDFVALLARTFETQREELLLKRVQRQAELDTGKMPDFLPETESIRNDSSWRIAPIPADLQERR